MKLSPSILGSLAAATLLAGCVRPHNTVDTKEEPAYMRERSAPQSTVEAYRGPKRRIAVIEFENKTPYGHRELGDSATDILITELQKTGQFTLIEREKVQHLMDEQRFSNSDAAEPATAAKLGRMLGVQAIVTGSVSQFGVKEEGVDNIVYQRRDQIADCTVDIRIIDVSSGEILVADSGRGEAKKTITGSMGLGGRASYDPTLAGDALRAATFKYVKNIVDRMGTVPFTARVAQVDSGKVYLDAGRATGVTIGQEFEVMRPGKEIISPTTGKVIGETTNHIGRVRVVDFFGDDGAVAESLEGQPQVKDIVRLANAGAPPVKK
ncbi:MAG TPA: CsgG/HfaB family protein [bacterium]|nr:CsgG/HfaB family protein [bacterium]